MTTDLIAVDDLVPTDVFAGNGVLDGILAEIDAKCRAHQPDTSTAKGQSEIKSLANKVARSKTFLDDMGKALVADLKKQTGAIDKERKKLRDHLDALKAEVRQPITDLEEAAAAKYAEVSRQIEAIRELPYPLSDTLEGIDAKVTDVESIDPKAYGPRAAEAALAKDDALAMLRDHRGSFVQEQERRAAEEAAREQRERERAAEAERMAEERAKQVAEDAVRHERERVEAEERQKRLAAERAEAEELRRMANKEHRRKVNAAALKAFVDHAGLTEDQAKAAVQAIANDDIPAVRIQY